MLSVKNLTKIYKTKGGEDVKALNNVSLDFPETGMVFLLGKSGSGKSTLLNLIGGLDAPTSGEVILKGKSSKSVWYLSKSKVKCMLHVSKRSSFSNLYLI